MVQGARWPLRVAGQWVEGQFLLGFLLSPRPGILTSKPSWLELQKIKRKAGPPLKCSYVAGIPNKTFETNAFARSCLSLSL